MKRMWLVCLLGASTMVSASTWNNVVLMDQSCSAKAESKANPDAHSRSCALQCSKAGYGIVTADGKYLKFDQVGSEQALRLLNASGKKDHLRVVVEGEQKNDTIAVKSIRFE